MDVHFVSDDGTQQHPVGQLEQLLARDHGWSGGHPRRRRGGRPGAEGGLWLPPLAVQAGVERNAVPKVRASRDHLFVILHAPELGTGGHVHYVELDQFIGPRYLITVHGPVNPAVTPEATLRETRAVLGRIQAGRLRPPVGVRAVRCHRLGPGPGPGGVRGDRDPPGVAAGAAGHLRPPG
jgi:magnesium transporter